jgi:hypothetical protein
MPSLWKPPTGIALIRQRRRERTVTLPDGTRAKVTVEGSEQAGFVQQTETDDRLDGTAYPRTIRYTFRPERR